MPNVWTHLIFAQKLLNQAGQEALIAKAQSRRIFNLGAQGPDLLYYHRFAPWAKSMGLPELGTELHRRHCGTFLTKLVDAVAGLPLNHPHTLYVLGFLSHYVLDRTLHPYIYFKSGHGKWDHQRFEVIIDTILVKGFLGRSTWKMAGWKQFHVGYHLPSGIALMLDTIAHELYPSHTAAINSAHWDEAYRDMISAHRLFHDPFHIKRFLTFGRIDPFVYSKNYAPLDYTNEARQEWRHPASPAEIHHESFWDLWNDALKDGDEIYEAVLQYLIAAHTAKQDQGVHRKGASLEALRTAMADAIGNDSYESGKDCTIEWNMEFVSPIFCEVEPDE